MKHTKLRGNWRRKPAFRRRPHRQIEELGPSELKKPPTRTTGALPGLVKLWPALDEKAGDPDESESSKIDRGRWNGARLWK